MEYGARRRKATKNRSKMISGRERRMLIQLAASLLLFAVALVGRNVFPERMEQWNQLLRRNIDFQSAFSAFGESAMQGESLMDSLEELCVEVFAGGELRKTDDSLVFQKTIPLTERYHAWERERTTHLRKGQ